MKGGRKKHWRYTTTTEDCAFSSKTREKDMTANMLSEDTIWNSKPAFMHRPHFKCLLLVLSGTYGCGSPVITRLSIILPHT
jgi:hypothetical protein